MRRDTIFYQLFKRSPWLLFDLVPNLSIDGHNYRFESVEVKESSFRIDGVFLPPEDSSPKIVFFTEVQFQRDDTLYHRFFSEVFLYLYRNRWSYDDWQGVILLASRSLEPKDQYLHRSLLASDQVYRVYLDEVKANESQSLGIQLIQLTIASESEMVAQAQQLVEQVRLADGPNFQPEEIIEMITTIVVYKFSDLNREEVETMLGLNIEDARILREAKRQGREEGLEQGKEEGRQEMLAAAVPLLLQAGFSVEQIAQQLKVSEAEIRQFSLPTLQS